MITPVASVNILQLPGGAVLAPDVGDPGLLQADLADDVVFFVWSGVALKDISMKNIIIFCNT